MGRMTQGRKIRLHVHGGYGTEYLVCKDDVVAGSLVSAESSVDIPSWSPWASNFLPLMTRAPPGRSVSRAAGRLPRNGTDRRRHHD